MGLSRSLLAALAAFTIGGFVGAAEADDFTFEVPVQLSNVAPGARVVEVYVDCKVFAVVDSFASRDLVAERREGYILSSDRDPIVGPVTDSRVLTLRMNASRVRAASDARYWACTLYVGAQYPEGSYAIGHSDDPPTSEVYERVTHHRLIRAVTRIDGEIPR